MLKCHIMKKRIHFYNLCSSNLIIGHYYFTKKQNFFLLPELLSIHSALRYSKLKFTMLIKLSVFDEVVL